jgi:hypothetical protein
MKLQRLVLVAALLAGLAGVAWVSQEVESAGLKMTAAGEKFVGTLTAEQKGKAVFGFGDKERTNWHFVPYQTKDKKPMRKGLALEDMTAEQKEAAKGLVKAGLSQEGFAKATTIMSLESILRDLEKNGAMVRDPEWYYFTVFGTPSKTGKWGWRVEGHHLSLNFALDRGKVIGSTPAFFGANPALVMQGDRKGLRTLPEAEDPAKDLFESLDEGQRKVAFQGKHFPEIEEGKATANVGEPLGLPASRMNEKQKGILLKLMQGYADRLPPDVAQAEMSQAKEAGIDKVHFAFAREDDKPGKPYTYRVQGPTFVIEFLNVQSDSARNPANHIHSVWRNLKNDFGLAEK